MRTGQPTFADMYERELTGALFRHFAEAALNAADLSPHGSLLDVACGTGCVARLARERWGPHTRVVGADINIDMLAVARISAPGIDSPEGGALALPRGRSPRRRARFHICFRLDADGAEHGSSGMFDVFDPPHRLAMSRYWDSDDGPDSHIDVIFRRVDQGTEITLVHSRLRDRSARDQHQQR